MITTLHVLLFFFLQENLNLMNFQVRVTLTKETFQRVYFYLLWILELVLPFEDLKDACHDKFVARQRTWPEHTKND